MTALFVITALKSGDDCFCLIGNFVVLTHYLDLLCAFIWDENRLKNGFLSKAVMIFAWVNYKRQPIHFDPRAILYAGRAMIWIEATNQYRERPSAKASLATARGTDAVDALQNPYLGVPGI